MSTQTTIRKIDAIEADPKLGKDDKLAQLREIYLDARATQRAMTEGGMGAAEPENDVNAAIIRRVEEVLESLGVDPLIFEDDNAASL